MLFKAEEASKFADITVPAWAWIALLTLILAMLAADLYRHRHHTEPTFKAALNESIVWTAFGVAFAGVIYAAFKGTATSEYFAAYILERALSLDNVFVWSMLFTAFATPIRYQHRVLFWGIFGALALRAIFIGVGAALIEKFWPVMILFGAILIWSGVKIFREGDEDSGEAKMPGIKLLRRFLPVTDKYEDAKFFTMQNGKRAATPLFAALVVIELSDVVFAVDSVPAALGVTREMFLVFSANAFAILGLRAMYFLLADAKERFHHLSTALGFVLIFIGIKMVVAHWIHISTPISLGVIVACLAAGVYASLKFPPKGHEPVTDAPMK
jgi:tellurite resistance protein TerC